MQLKKNIRHQHHQLHVQAESKERHGEGQIAQRISSLKKNIEKVIRKSGFETAPSTASATRHQQHRNPAVLEFHHAIH